MIDSGAPKRSTIGIMGNQRKPMNLFSRGYHGQWYCSWARTHDDDDDDGVAQHGGHNRNEAKFISRPHPQRTHSGVDEIFSRTSLKEKGREQELTGTEVARKIAKESGRGLKKGGENGSEQCREVEQVKKEMKKYRTMP